MDSRHFCQGLQSLRGAAGDVLASLRKERTNMSDTPFMYWVGMNTPPDTSADELAKFNDFYSNIHAPEVVKGNPGFVRATRYELSGPDPRGDLGPRWLAVYEMDSEAAAQGYSARNDGPPEGRPA